MLLCFYIISFEQTKMCVKSSVMSFLLDAQYTLAESEIIKPTFFLSCILNFLGFFLYHAL